MKTISIALFACCGLLFVPVPVLADAGHSHGGKKNGYDGHAAALGQPGDPKVPARSITVIMTDEMRFEPATIDVRRGETIRFLVRNAGEIRHEMSLGTREELTEHAKLMEQHPEMEHDDPNAVTVDPGQSRPILWKFTKAGTFDFACLIPGHMQAGMTGRIVVR